MREEMIRALSDVLYDNIGSRLTPALATGIATLINQALLQREAEDAKAVVADSQPVE